MNGDEDFDPSLYKLERDNTIVDVPGSQKETFKVASMQGGL